MTNFALQVENLSKKYQIGRKRLSDATLIQQAFDIVKAPVRRVSNLLTGKQQSAAELDEDFWALQDISFQVKRGEVLGIIGQNGAGKSTLLKLLSRITYPTKGRIKIYGNVGSLLEVGTGFHAELTGRENVYMNGAILGMTKRDLDLKFDEIVEFAGVESFIDTPFKHYSSGMGVRLAFAVAAHFEPEILIVDEVLSVGDASFQQKSLGKMNQVASEGRTVLFVSHNISVVRQLCQRGILLKQGRIVIDSDINETIDAYIGDTKSVDGYVEWSDGIANEGVNEVKVHSVRIRNEDGEITPQIDYTKDFCLEVEYTLLQPLSHLRAGFIISNNMRIDVMTTYDADVYPGKREVGRYTSRCHIPGYLLAPGSYTVSLNIGMIRMKNLCWIENLLSFSIIETEKLDPNEKGARSGIIRPKLDWEIIS